MGEMWAIDSPSAIRRIDASTIEYRFLSRVAEGWALWRHSNRAGREVCDRRTGANSCPRTDFGRRGEDKRTLKASHAQASSYREEVFLFGQLFVVWSVVRGQWSVVGPLRSGQRL